MDQFQVNYTCKDGYYFGSDYNQQAFTLTCFTNGTVGGADWAQCYHPSERFCFDPPAKPFNGGQVRLDSIAPKAYFCSFAFWQHFWNMKGLFLMTKSNFICTERLEWGALQWIEDTVCNSGALLLCPREEAVQVPAGRNNHVWRGQLHLPVGSHVVARYWGRQIN